MELIFLPFLSAVKVNGKGSQNKPVESSTVDVGSYDHILKPNEVRENDNMCNFTNML